MPFTTTNLRVVQCDVPDCGMFRYFVGPKELQGTGWLEVYRLGDDGSHQKQYVCPKHAALLKLRDVWTAPPMRFSENSAIQQLLELTGTPKQATLDSGDRQGKLLTEGEKKGG